MSATQTIELPLLQPERLPNLELEQRFLERMRVGEREIVKAAQALALANPEDRANKLSAIIEAVDLANKIRARIEYERNLETLGGAL